MASINEPQITIMTLAKDVNDVARNILRRSDSIADCLGGSHPECGNDGKEIEPNDIHGMLQRILSTLRATQDELSRSESIIGIATPDVLVAKNAFAGQTATSARY